MVRRHHALDLLRTLSLESIVERGGDGGDGLSLPGVGLQQAGGETKEDEDKQGCCSQHYAPLTLVQFGTRRRPCWHRRGEAHSVFTNRQQDDAKPGAACLEAPKYVSPIASAKGDDTVAEARPILKLVGEFPSYRGVDLHPDVRVEVLKLRELLLGGKSCHLAILEGAQHVASRELMSALAPLRRRPHPGANIEKNLIGIAAVDLLVKVGELRSHAWVDLYDSDAVLACIVHHLDIE